MKYINAKLNR